ncbi:MAG: hypothetical protein ABI647_25490 [Gemmatimonadota bacterium]
MMNARMSYGVLMGLALGAACRATPPANLENGAKSQADLAADTTQARLWRDAADRAGAQTAVAKPVDTAVTNRIRPQVPSRPVAAQSVAFPAEMRGGLRVDALPDLPAGGYSGSARVADITGERIGLELPGQPPLRLTLTARARGGALRLTPNEQVQLELRARDDPTNRQRIVALATKSDGIVSVLETGTKPVTATVRLFGLVARQVGNPDSGTMSVEVQIRGERQVMRPGQLLDFPGAGLTVGLIGSTALTGADRFRAEGNPYAIDLVAWRR